MITITQDTHQEKLGIVEKEIILNGPPSNLQGHVQFINPAEDSLRVKTLTLVEDKKNKSQIGSNDFLRLSFKLQPGEKKMKSITHQLSITTPPGTYESYVMLGKEKHRIKMIVQTTIDVQLYPTRFMFQGTAPGTKHTAVITLSNLGNVPFEIPNLKHAAVLDMDLLCRAFGVGFREQKGSGLVETLDEVTQNIKSHLVDWVSITVEEMGKVVQSGESTLLHVHFVMPKNADAKQDYDGAFRFWDREISIAVKSREEQKKPNNYGKQEK